MDRKYKGDLPFGFFFFLETIDGRGHVDRPAPCENSKFGPVVSGWCTGVETVLAFQIAELFFLAEHEFVEDRGTTKMGKERREKE